MQHGAISSIPASRGSRRACGKRGFFPACFHPIPQIQTLETRSRLRRSARERNICERPELFRKCRFALCVFIY